MPQELLIYLDANIFIHALEPATDEERPRSNLLLKMMAIEKGTKPNFFMTSELTFGELWVGAYKTQNKFLIKEYDRISISGGVIDVRPVALSIIRNAAKLRAQNVGLRTPDAIHLATALDNGCTHFLTSDLRIKGAVHNTDGTSTLKTTGPELIIIRPDTSTIEQLSVALEANA